MRRRTTIRNLSVAAMGLMHGCTSGDAPERPIVGAVVLAAAGTVGDEAHGVGSPVAVVDSAHPMAVLIERFQADMPEPTALVNGLATRDSLVRAFITALDRRDTTAVARLFITRAEFAYLYFPASRLSRAPYEIDPAFAWFQLTSESEHGVRKALDLLGGRDATYLGSTCEPAQAVGTGVTTWSGCTVRWRAAGREEATLPVFSSIIEHGGRFKFLSFVNKL